MLRHRECHILPPGAGHHLHANRQPLWGRATTHHRPWPACQIVGAGIARTFAQRIGHQHAMGWGGIGTRRAQDHIILFHEAKHGAAEPIHVFEHGRKLGDLHGLHLVKALAQQGVNVHRASLPQESTHPGAPITPERLFARSAVRSSTAGRSSSTLAPASANCRRRVRVGCFRRRRHDAIVRIHRDAQPCMVTACGSPRGIGTMAGSRQSTPAMIGSVNMRSSTYRAMGPSCVSASTAPIPNGTTCPVLGTRPEVGLMPAMPQKWAGRRILPPVSLPISSAEPPEARIAPAPTAPAWGARHIVRVVGAPVDEVVGLSRERQFRRVRLPSKWRRQRAAVPPLWRLARAPGRVPGTAVEMTPAVSSESLMVMGTPCSGPATRLWRGLDRQPGPPDGRAGRRFGQQH